MAVETDRRSRNPMSWKYRRWGAERVYYLSRRLYLRGWHRLAYVLKFLNTYLFRAYIPPLVAIGQRLELPHGGFGVVMHEDTVIGDDATILHNVTIGNGGARIGNRVYFGSGVTILGAVTIGDDVVIGAGAVVTFDVPTGSYVAGPKGRLFVGGNPNVAPPGSSAAAP